MKEYRIEIEEAIFLEHEVIVEVPKEICTIDIFEYIENECQNKSEISEYIKKLGGRQLNFIEGNSGDSELIVRSCKKIKKEKKRMENNFWWTLSDFEEVGKIVTRESIKDLENAMNEIENEAEEVKILITKKNGDEKYINFKHDGYMKDVIKDKIVECFEEIRIMHEAILEEM